MDAGRITALSNVPGDSTFLFRVAEESDEDREREAILVRNGVAENDGDNPTDGHDGLSCWLNYCQHLTHIKLDKGSGAPMRNGELVCANHGAYFDTDTGRCTFGPCEGAFLTELEIEIAAGDVYLTDDDFAFVGIGPIERDDFDRSSTSNVEF